MVGWQRHFQSLLRQAAKRLESRNVAPNNFSYHTKASSSILGMSSFATSGT